MGRYIYNGAVCITTDLLDGTLMVIADKYNFSELFDAIDSLLAHKVMYKLWDHKFKLKVWLALIKIVEKARAPKLTAALFQRKNCESSEGNTEMTDAQWSTNLRKNSNFSMLLAHVCGRQDYHNWMKQHEKWKFSKSFYDDDDLAIIVGSHGDMKG